jgi:hypothetical protein
VLDALEVVLLLLLATGTLASCRGSFPDVLLTEVVLVVLEYKYLIYTMVVILTIGVVAEAEVFTPKALLLVH